ncbi:MAG: type II toxin-antitoxin system RelE/ParE family toxin [Verrucomicrobia bacterium]|nr:type II toxin-antitoxin system RelE/ParE family toxin [Verrucomicrobiota bacterium]
MKPIRFHPEAESEMIEAAAWYESQQTGLGKRFLTSVQDALNRVELNPALYPFVERDVRRCLTKTFPFGVLFRIKPDVIAIMAIMHLHRDPDCWKNRRFEP